MDIEYRIKLLVEKAGGRIISSMPEQGFLPPRRVTVVDAAGVHSFEPKDWDEIEWTGPLPRGFLTQTCFLFRYEGGKLEEIEKPMQPDPVII